MRIPQRAANWLAIAFGIGGWSLVMRDGTPQVIGWLCLFVATFFFAVFSYQRREVEVDKLR